MKIEKTVLKVSLVEMIQITMAGLVFMNLMAYVIFTLILQTPFREIFHRSGMIFFLVPLIQGILQPLINRPILLTIESNEKYDIIRRKIEELLIHLKYRAIESKDNYTFYNYTAKWKRIINSPFNMAVKTTSENESIRIYGKGIILNQIESKLYQDRDLRES